MLLLVIDPFCRFEHVKIPSTCLEATQLKEIFSVIKLEEEPALKYLNIGLNDLSSLPVEALLESVGKLEGLSVRNSDISADTFTGLFSKIGAGDDEHIKLETLNISKNNFLGVPPDIMSLAICRLKIVNISSCDFDENNWNVFFEGIVKSQHFKLEYLDISDCYLASVSSKFISEALVKIETVNASSTELSNSQLLEIMTEILETPELVLKSLNLSVNILSSLPPHLLSHAVCKLEESQLERTRLSCNHIERILQQISQEEELTLKSLNLSWNDISTVAPFQLRAILRLTDVYLRRTNLREEQLEILIDGRQSDAAVALTCLDVSLNHRLSVQSHHLSWAKSKLKKFIN